ncbi:MAG: hypothetical protein LBK73_15225, partial [Treponema sp.]|nr:hypothetical protein [Treponema sp.]
GLRPLFQCPPPPPYCLTLSSHTTKAYNRSLYKKYKDARETGIACPLSRNAAISLQNNGAMTDELRRVLRIPIHGHCA